MIKNEHYEELSNRLSKVIIMLEEIIKYNANKDHVPRYNNLLKYLIYYREKAETKDWFSQEFDNMGLKLSNFIESSFDPKEFYVSVIAIDNYFFHHFLLGEE